MMVARNSVIASSMISVSSSDLGAGPDPLLSGRIGILTEAQGHGGWSCSNGSPLPFGSEPRIEKSGALTEARGHGGWEL